MTEPILPPLKPIPIKGRVSVMFVEKGNLDVLDGAFVLIDKGDVRTNIPVGGVSLYSAGHPEAHGPIVCFIRPNWPWMTLPD